jgi:hypothetical protein
MSLHSKPASLRVRLLRTLAGAVAIVGVAGLGSAGTATAAPVHKGFLVLSVTNGAVTTVTQLPPGQAVQVATATCAGRGTPVAAALTVDAVRAAFPAPVVACAGVTLTSQVAAAGA